MTLLIQNKYFGLKLRFISEFFFKNNGLKKVIVKKLSLNEKKNILNVEIFSVLNFHLYHSQAFPDRGHLVYTINFGLIS